MNSEVYFEFHIKSNHLEHKVYWLNKRNIIHKHIFVYFSYNNNEKI